MKDPLKHLSSSKLGDETAPMLRVDGSIIPKPGPDTPRWNLSEFDWLPLKSRDRFQPIRMFK